MLYLLCKLPVVPCWLVALYALSVTVFTAIQYVMARMVQDSQPVVRVRFHGASPSFAVEPSPGKTIELRCSAGFLLPLTIYRLRPLLPSAASISGPIPIFWCHLSDKLVPAGVYNEQALVALDYITYRAGQYGVKIIAVLADNWQQADSTVNVSLEGSKDCCKC